MSPARILRAVVALPFTVTVLIPVTILTINRFEAVKWSLAGAVSGTVLVLAGLCFLASTIHMFAVLGRGTLAPWDPPDRLVVKGIYRYVRNPMISGVFAILLGEALLFGSLPLFYWFIIFVAGNLLYIPILEERGLEKRFEEDYRRYKRNVPRWIPRLKAWNPEPGLAGEAIEQ